MKKDQVIVEQIFDVPAERIWKAITEKNEMKQWYFDLTEFKPAVGFEFSFPGQGAKGEKYQHHCKITEVIPTKKLQYIWKYENYEGSSLVTFELFPEGKKTKLKLTHTGLSTFPDNPDFAWESFNQGWTELITKSLHNYLGKVLA